MGRKLSNPSESPVRGRGSPHRRSPSRREKSPTRRKASHRVSPPTREKHSSRSPSPQTKRLRGAHDERKDEKVSERERERNHGRGSDKGAHRERGLDKEILNERRGSDKGAHRERGLDKEILDERKERRSGRDENDGKSSRARHGRSSSPSDHHHRSRHRSHSPQAPSDSRARDEVTNSRGNENTNDDDDSVAKMKAAEDALEEKQKQKPSFELSGKLAAETNRFRGVTLLFSEPPDARKPDIRWRLYVFKGGEVLNEPLYIHRQSCYLFGRERRVADIPTDHPSCSKQHAVIQFRQVEKEKPDGTPSKQARPYIMDLGSTNKTFINDNAIEPQRYYELFEKDTIKFGNSSREYVLLHENSAQ